MILERTFLDLYDPWSFYGKHSLVISASLMLTYIEDVCIVCSCMIETGGLCMVCALRSSETMDWMVMSSRLCCEHRVLGQAWL